jgi:hypothetical protein
MRKLVAKTEKSQAPASAAASPANGFPDGGKGEIRIMPRKTAPTLNIGALNLTVQNAMGHEHRIEPIAQRAASVLAKRLRQLATDNAVSHLDARIDSLTAAPVDFNLRSMSNDQAANVIASAWLDAVAQRFRF